MSELVSKGSKISIIKILSLDLTISLAKCLNFCHNTRNFRCIMNLSSIGRQFTWVYQSCRKPLLENKRGVLITAIAGTAIAGAIYSYKRLFPLKLTDAEKRDLADSCQKYSPQVFVDRLSASLTRNDDAGNPNTPEEWFKWIGSASDEQLLDKTKKVAPTYRERIKLSIEDERAHTVQTWAINLEPVFAFIRESSSGWKGLLGPIQMSPRLAYTILFNGMAPFAARAIWNGLSKRLPQRLQEIGNQCEQHQGKIALTALTTMGLLYWKMRNEKGFITNLTENFTRFRLPHKGLDQINSYAEGIKEIQNVIHTSRLGELGSNIFWYYSKDTHSTFKREIGRTLAEMAAAGRGNFQGQQVVELDLDQFLIEYLSKADVIRGWNETRKYLADNPNCLVVFKGMSEIKSFLLPKVKQDPAHSFQGKGRNEAEKMLAKLIKIDIAGGRFRCLIELDEREQQQMEKTEFGRCFTSIRAPDLQPNEIQELCNRFYVDPQIAISYKRKEIEQLFAHLIPHFDKAPIPPDTILDILRADFRQRAIDSRSQPGDRFTEVQKNERALDLAEHMKEELLEKVWRYRQITRHLMQQLLLVEYVVLPLLKQINRSLIGEIRGANLVLKAQKKLRRLVGHCTQEEADKLLHLPELLGEVIQGQGNTLQAICKAIYAWRKVPPLDGKPLVLFFAGPPGVGKSKTATQIAFHLNSIYGVMEKPSPTSEKNVIRINLNRKSQGAFVGWEKVKAEILAHLHFEPATVVILEEWDKMGEKDKGSILELLDDTKHYQEEPWGYGNTNGPYVDKSSAIFILTSNIHSENIEEGIKNSFGSNEEKSGEALISRIDAMIPFQELGKEGQRELIKVYLDNYVRRKILPEDKRETVEAKLLENEHMPDAREIQRIIQEVIHLGN